LNPKRWGGWSLPAIALIRRRLAVNNLQFSIDANDSQIEACVQPLEAQPLTPVGAAA
jgi:hypothetical protein